MIIIQEFGGVDKIFYVKDPLNGLKHSESVSSWWRRALRDPKVLKDGCILFIPGPPVTDVSLNSFSQRNSRYLDILS